MEETLKKRRSQAKVGRDCLVMSNYFNLFVAFSVFVCAISGKPHENGDLGDVTVD